MNFVILHIATLTTMLVISVILLIITQFPSTLSSTRTRLILGSISSAILGLGVLIMGGAIPAFCSTIAIVAAFPRIKKHRPSIIGSVPVILYIAKSFIVLDFSNYYQVNELLIASLIITHPLIMEIIVNLEYSKFKLHNFLESIFCFKQFVEHLFTASGRIQNVYKNLSLCTQNTLLGFYQKIYVRFCFFPFCQNYNRNKFLSFF